MDEPYINCIHITYEYYFSGMFNKGPLSCKVLAVSMYFFYMSSFFWMMIIAFDVCKTLKMATTQLRLTTGSQWRKFSLYSTVAWGLPVAFVTVVTILDHVEAMPEAFKPGNYLID
jgi:G protein-coupled receptor Mth (Methuselah protein)